TISPAASRYAFHGVNACERNRPILHRREEIMSALRPRSRLETHEVTNQPPPFEDINLFETDAALREAVSRSGGVEHFERLVPFGCRAGSAEVVEWAARANEFVPQLKAFDRLGR